MKVISLNANGIRAAERKGFFQWMQQQDPDVVCIQETKAQEHQLDEKIFCPAGYHCYYFDAEKKGYSGVAIYSKQKPDNVITGLGWDVADKEGRYIQIDFDKLESPVGAQHAAPLSIVSLYLPSGTSGDERQAIKFDFLDRFMSHLKDLKGLNHDLILCGDWNIAHTKKDIKNWRGNQKHSGFLPEERAWLDDLFGPAGFVDAFRVINQEEDQYTWWSNRGQAWAKNVGWRIDYQVITPSLQDKVKAAEIYKDERFSDHAPLIIEYDI